MRPFATNLRARTSQLGLTQGDVARVAGLSERRIGNYYSDAREPDLGTLVRLASALGVTPNDLLLEKGGNADRRIELQQRLIGLSMVAEIDDLEVVVRQAEVLIVRAK